ncbi:MAG: alpha/beta hydrolase [Bacteroidetes bacterium]|nr:alpha/beta hydrolase [Bacteroidota bacterium]MBP7399212.1 alpha/beta hydrolase [Chitinophagales bacterium]MBK7108979.1 alpha/beta hydrolase [Bacteroidota bacterium]MBK8488696.1 alpha/beta hydrolase [Bacteroidota bacterium]MBK8681548.1 alpha/beta hydrolase [Bacteroidota bacterium]
MNYRVLVFTLINVCLLQTLQAQNSIGLMTEKEYAVTPADYGLNFEEIKIETPDKNADNTPLTLFGWHLIPAEKLSKKAVIIASNGQGNMANSLEYAGLFLGMGYHVFMFDYRGYGQSDDFNVNPKFYIYAQFGTDLNAVVDHVKKYFATLTITVYGQGIGAGLALGVSANNVKVNNVIADGPYTTLETIEKRYKEFTGGKIMMPLAFDKALIEPLNALAVKGDQLRGIMLIVGAKGDYVTPADITSIADLKKKVTTVYVVPNVNNDENFSSNKDQYFKEVKAFLDKLN